MSGHTDQAFEAELQVLRGRLVGMASRVEAMIAQAARSLVEGDASLADCTVALDPAVNQDEMDIDDMVIQLLARRQPLASDLRFIVTATRMATDLERIGDLAVGICRRGADLRRAGGGPVHPAVPRMALVVEGMVHEAAVAFVRADADAAQAVLEQDDVVDDLLRELFGELLGAMVDGHAQVATTLPVLNAARALERIGDHATNLAEEVIYVVRGRDVRHGGRGGSIT